jgi:hypothetical protein
VVLLLQEWIPIEPNHFICDTICVEKVSHSFSHKQHNLGKARHLKRVFWEYLLTMVGKIYVNAPVNSNMITTTVTVILITPLPHSQYVTTSMLRAIPQSRRSAKERIRSRRYTRYIRLADSEYTRFRIFPVNGLDHDSDHSSK